MELVEGQCMTSAMSITINHDEEEDRYNTSIGCQPITMNE